MTPTRFDIIIAGGGIAGLWTLAQLRHQGYNAILLEKNTLGGGQSMASQGIIHGGSKYALAGAISQATSNISQMPQRWQQALTGDGPVNLSAVKCLSDAQYLVPSSGIDSKLLSFLGSKSMSSFTESTKARNLPAAYRQAGIQRNSFRLNETVLDTGSLFATLLAQYRPYIFQATVDAEQISQQDDGVSLALPAQTLHCKRLVLAAGAGNASLPDTDPMQSRPLHMVMLKDQQLPLIYAHFIGRSSKPLLTITAHPTDNGTVWYMGGDLAENGVELDEPQQIDKARQLLHKLLPDLSLSDQHRFACLRISRAEPRQSSLLRPDDAHVRKHGAIIAGWPTKLALAPRFADQVQQQLDIAPSGHTQAIALPLAQPPLADYPWSTL